MVDGDDTRTSFAPGTDRLQGRAPIGVEVDAPVVGR